MTPTTHADSVPVAAATAGAQPRIADHLRRDKRNVFATMAVFAGIASWVPLVIVLAFPLTLVCAVLALVTAVRKDQRRGLKAAWVGVVLAVSALALHLAVTLAGLMLAYLVPAIRNVMTLWSM